MSTTTLTDEERQRQLRINHNILVQMVTNAMSMFSSEARTYTADPAMLYESDSKMYTLMKEYVASALLCFDDHGIPIPESQRPQ
jgi:hypothetical protein